MFSLFEALYALNVSQKLHSFYCIIKATKGVTVIAIGLKGSESRNQRINGIIINVEFFSVENIQCFVITK